ncbi:rna-directed dna polymerase from mobile element jockey-like [Limosa lapponica baueri]|uniref:Rna-directed dna polymerase from mobile element jockey-like n=1 Tax=Limosa lapponica baueri TaxID=1758121 RepID=A0A2I0TCK7_LIMLA|nr:rna-directed dna polymerase from mobile element jockey-like [Limosa lapponica baueri]
MTSLDLLVTLFLMHPRMPLAFLATRAQSRRFLQCIDDNFLTQMLEEPTRRDALLDLVLTNKEGLVEDVKVGGSLGCSDHEKMEFRIVGTMHKTSRTETLDFRRANFDLFKKLLGETSWDRALEGREAPESWSIFKHLQTFFKYISSKRKTRENVGPLLNEVGALVTENAEKAEFFALIFTAKAVPQEPQTLEVERD